MKKVVLIAMALCGSVLAQPPGGGMPSPEEIMKRNDANEDGVITKDEVENSGRPIAQMFGNIDTNKDGKIDLEELKNMNMGPPGGGQMPQPQQ